MRSESNRLLFVVRKHFVLRRGKPVAYGANHDKTVIICGRGGAVGRLVRGPGEAGRGGGGAPVVVEEGERGTEGGDGVGPAVGAGGDGDDDRDAGRAEAGGHLGGLAPDQGERVGGVLGEVDAHTARPGGVVERRVLAQHAATAAE